jgi:hypothetical protein
MMMELMEMEEAWRKPVTLRSAVWLRSTDHALLHAMTKD